jgi:hypothetical protein
MRHPNSSRVRDFSRSTDFVSLVENKGHQVWRTGWLGMRISAANPAICMPTEMRCKAPYTLSVKLSDFTVWRHTWRKNWVNCAVLTGNSADLWTVLSSRLSHRELRSSLRVSHSFLSVPSDTTMASSQGTSVSSNSFSRWASHDIFLFKYHLLLYILRFLSSFRITLLSTWLANSKRQPFFFIHYSHTHKKTHRTDKPDGKPVLCQRTFSSVFRAVFLYS